MNCANCGGPIAPGAGRTFEPDHGTSASPTITVHADPAACAPSARVRRTPRPVSH